MSKTQTLSNLDTGRWLVATESSAYILDLDARTARRSPGYGVGPVSNGHVHLSQMRRDEAPIPLEEIITLEVGKPMLLLLDVREDGVLTLRRSTIVAAITEITDHPSS